MITSRSGRKIRKKNLEFSPEPSKTKKRPRDDDVENVSIAKSKNNCSELNKSHVKRTKLNQTYSSSRTISKVHSDSGNSSISESDDHHAIIVSSGKATTLPLPSSVSTHLEFQCEKLFQLNPRLFSQASILPPAIDGIQTIDIILLETPPHIHDVNNTLYIEADQASKHIIAEISKTVHIQRKSLDFAIESTFFTFPFLGPSFIPVILSHIAKQNEIEDKCSSQPTTYFLKTFMNVKDFHESIMPLANVQNGAQLASIHSWILSSFDQPAVRAYLTLVKYIQYFDHRSKAFFPYDKSIPGFVLAEEFLNTLVLDPYSSLIQDIVPLDTTQKVIILVNCPEACNDKLALIPLLIRGLATLGCLVQKVDTPVDAITAEYEKFKAVHSNGIGFVADITLKEGSQAASFGPLIFSFDLCLKLIEPQGCEAANTLDLKTRDHDGSIVTADTLSNNNITPGCICRYYLEHIRHFVQTFLLS